MNIKDNQPDSTSELRKKAEKELQQKMDPSIADLATLSPEKIRQLIHELEVHQIELEMQNDELLRVQEELETSRKLYFYLYDLAPVGYCVVSEKGLILKANLTVATLLGKARNELINQPITRFIFKEDQDIYYRHQKMLFETGQPQTVQLQMLRTDSPPFWARLDTTIAENAGQTSVSQVTLTDISESKRSEHQLKERIKELNFFFSLSDLLEKPDISLDGILEKTVLLIPLAWQFPEIAEACIEVEGQIFQTKGFRKTQWMLISNIIIQEKTIGQVMVCYLEDRPIFDDEPFMINEHRLLNAVGQRLGHIIERVRMTETVKQSEEFLRTAINAITNPFAVINAMDYTVEIANAAYCGGKATGLKCHAVSHQRNTPCTGDDYPCSVLEVKRTGKPFIGEHVHYDDQGNQLNIETYAFPASDPNGQIVQIIEYQIDITARRQTELELKQKATELEEMNTALKVLLKRREQDKYEIEEKIFANYQLLITPIIQNLKKTLTQKNQKDIINILESNLKNILSPFSKKLSDKLINLTPTEIHVADLIKLGKSNKEISEILNCSVHTISRHRDNIRIKTGLKNKKLNLRSFLLSLQ